MHARMLSVVVFLPELSTVARRVLLLELSTHCSRQLYELVPVLLLRCSRAARGSVLFIVSTSSTTGTAVPTAVSRYYYYRTAGQYYSCTTQL